MEIDRISQIAPLSRDRVTPWPDAPHRRRKFVEEFPDPDSDPDSDSDAENPDSASSGSAASGDPASSSAPEPLPEDDEPHSFSVLA